MLILLAVMMSGCAKGDYTLKAKVKPGSLGRGERGKILFQTKAHGEYHLDPKGMVRITLTPSSDEIRLDKTALDQNDNAGDFTYSTEFIVGMNAPTGEANIKADVIFQLCTKELCRLVTEEKTVTFTVK